MIVMMSTYHNENLKYLIEYDQLMSISEAVDYPMLSDSKPYDQSFLIP